MSLTSTRHRFTVNIGGRVYSTDNLSDPDIQEQCNRFCQEAFGPSDPTKAVCALIKSGESLAPLMSRAEIGRLIGVLEQKMLSRARVR